MSFLSLTRAARAFRPALSRRFASKIPSHPARKSYRSIAWGTVGVGVVATYMSLTNSKTYCDSPVQVPEAAKEDTVVDPATSIAFPKTMRIPSTLKIPPLELVGVGVRTVSFLGVKVYSVGFYADLSNPNLKIPLDKSPEEKIEHIVRNTACVVRIVPTRNTSYTHLRDAFMRALQARLSAAIKDKTISEQVAMRVSSPMRVLKSLFPNSPLKKDTPLDIFLSAPIPNRQRPLVFRDLGSIEDDWLATEFVLNYFDSACPSPALKNNVLENIKCFQK